MSVKRSIAVVGLFIVLSQSLFSSDELIIKKLKEVFPTIKKTAFKHKTEIDEKKGVYLVDSSSFATFLLENTYPDVIKEMGARPGKSPREADYFDAIKNSAEKNMDTGWIQIDKLENAQPGDFIVWKNFALTQNRSGGVAVVPGKARSGMSGHIAIIVEAPVKDSKKRYRVKVCDASNGRHAKDTRGRRQSGIGVGYMWFSVDKNGEPNAYYWFSPKRRTAVLPIVVGRIADSDSKKSLKRRKVKR